ncbi:MAG TPA: DUF6659 family protein [Candidatus Nitrosotenuis sp.]|nr:DUF6659 family protein [Candidatus Nitrosotenuis sp.]
MNYDELCQKIMSHDKKIRFAGILGKQGDLISGGLSEGVGGFLTPNEAQMSMHYASQRWETRKNLAFKIGKPIYSLTLYEKITQLSIPINNSDILLISAETDIDHDDLIEFLLKTINENFKRT